VLTPLLDGFDGHEHLPYASSLCGACQDACPAKVPLADLLLELRADIAHSRTAPDAWKLGFKGFAAVTAHRRLWGVAIGLGGRIASLVAPLAMRGVKSRAAPRLVRAWTDSRELPLPAPQSFRRIWARWLRKPSAGGHSSAGGGPSTSKGSPVSKDSSAGGPFTSKGSPADNGSATGKER
jgi:L-lactate dehydrogenase complex protein LldF